EGPGPVMDRERGVAASGSVPRGRADEPDQLHRVAGHAGTRRYPCWRTVAMYRGARHESPSFERSDRTWRSTMLLGGASAAPQTARRMASRLTVWPAFFAKTKRIACSVLVRSGTVSPQRTRFSITSTSRPPTLPAGTDESRW